MSVRAPTLAGVGRGAGAAADEAAAPDTDAAADSRAIHRQASAIWQHHPRFSSVIARGTNSLENTSDFAETLSLTLLAGVRLWDGAEFWIDPEVDQGAGLSGTFGIAGFPNGDAYQIPNRGAYLRAPPVFVRQTVSLGGATQKVTPDLCTLGGTQSADRLVLAVGKFSVAGVQPQQLCP